MKLLLDTCVWGGAAKTLEKAGHDIVWTGAWDADPGDEDILAQAHEQEPILVTLDKDFGELAIVYGKPHWGMIRLVDISARHLGWLLLGVLALYAACDERLQIAVGRHGDLLDWLADVAGAAFTLATWAVWHRTHRRRTGTEVQ